MDEEHLTEEDATIQRACIGLQGISRGRNRTVRREKATFSELATASIGISNSLLFVNSVFVRALPFPLLDLRLSNTKAVMSHCAILQEKGRRNSFFSQPTRRFAAHGKMIAVITSLRGPRCFEQSIWGILRVTLAITSYLLLPLPGQGHNKDRLWRMQT